MPPTGSVAKQPYSCSSSSDSARVCRPMLQVRRAEPCPTHEHQETVKPYPGHVGRIVEIVAPLA